MEWIILSCAILTVALFILARIKVEKFNKQEKRIFKNAMKEIDKLNNKR
jgi:hypothetical protein